MLDLLYGDRRSILIMGLVRLVVVIRGLLGCIRLGLVGFRGFRLFCFLGLGWLLWIELLFTCHLDVLFVAENLLVVG